MRTIEWQLVRDSGVMVLTILLFNPCHPHYLELGIDDNVITLCSTLDLQIQVSHTELGLREGSSFQICKAGRESGHSMWWHEV